ncbi:response regulator [Rhodopila sp.]|uniref:response regulator n=1 Tax=Rhodopila sp. TaxID=2480087 RepID=UPI002B6993F6|nr:response regulator [Rhodopila sp.]HVZ10590.1 response regulator [Rhodopila sp.]
MRILVADDEFLILVVIEETLQDAGAEVVSAATLADAMEAAEDRSLSAAILDVRLGRHTTEAVAEILSERSVPFLFHSGQALPDSIRAKFPHARMLAKPVKQGAFVTAILEAVHH